MAARMRANRRLSVMMQTIGTNPTPPGRFPIPTGVNRLSVVLTLADGRQVPWTYGGAGLMAAGGWFASTIFPAGGASAEYLGVAFRLEMIGDVIRVHLAFVLENGEIVRPAAFDLPIGGGRTSVSLPGGGSISATLVGAHPLSAAEQVSFEGMTAAGRRSEAMNAARIAINAASDDAVRAQAREAMQAVTAASEVSARNWSAMVNAQDPSTRAALLQAARDYDAIHFPPQPQR
jgi:hypothetical protein